MALLLREWFWCLALQLSEEHGLALLLQRSRAALMSTVPSSGKVTFTRVTPTRERESDEELVLTTLQWPPGANL